MICLLLLHASCVAAPYLGWLGANVSSGVWLGAQLGHVCVCVHGVVCCAVACILGVYVWCVCGVSRIKLVLCVFVEVLCFHYLSHFDSSMLAFSIGVS
jgi:hypothetical protein